MTLLEVVFREWKRAGAYRESNYICGNDQNSDNGTRAASIVRWAKYLLLAAALLRLINERAAASSSNGGDDDVMSDRQSKDAAAAANEKKRVAKAARRRRRKQNKNAAAKQKANLMSRSRGGFISLLMMVSFGSIILLISPSSLIHSSDGSKKGEAPPAKPPSASRPLRQREHRSNNDNGVSPNIIVSPLPAVAQPPIISPGDASNHRVKIDALRSETCIDTPNWVDRYHHRCYWYYSGWWCSYADDLAGDMGPATENCCEW